MRMRLAAGLALAAVVAALVIVVLGRGGSEGPVTPLDDALGYFGRDAPAVAVLQTDVDGQQAQAAAGLLAKVPFAPQALGQVVQQAGLGQAIQRVRDLRPL